MASELSTKTKKVKRRSLSSSVQLRFFWLSERTWLSVFALSFSLALLHFGKKEFTRSIHCNRRRMIEAEVEVVVRVRKEKAEAGAEVETRREARVTEEDTITEERETQGTGEETEENRKSAEKRI